MAFVSSLGFKLFYLCSIIKGGAKTTFTAVFLNLRASRESRRSFLIASLNFHNVVKKDFFCFENSKSSSTILLNLTFKLFYTGTGGRKMKAFTQLEIYRRSINVLWFHFGGHFKAQRENVTSSITLKIDFTNWGKLLWSFSLLLRRWFLNWETFFCPLNLSFFHRRHQFKNKKQPNITFSDEMKDSTVFLYNFPFSCVRSKKNSFCNI